jgi:6-phosphogluconate dehydrogenase
MAQFGLIGLAVMGENLALNVERNGFSVAVYNRSREKTDKFMAERAQGRNFQATFSIPEFMAALERPRRILVMVKAGQPVDDMLAQLKPLMEPGDIFIDGGNSLYTDTARRVAEMEAANLCFFGMGVSGGEEGALNGPSLMPGGTEDAYEALKDILVAISAKADGDPCVTYIGPGGAGHYVKMVHNGIEYGDMQLIAEAYDLLKNTLGLTGPQLYEVFNEWNQTPELNSFLIEITAKVFEYDDPSTGLPLVEVILDKAGQKGTGRWTVMSALELGVPIPTIIAAVNARIMSSMKSERVDAAKSLTGPTDKYDGDVKAMIGKIRDALYCSKICSYAQGMALIGKAAAYRFDLKTGQTFLPDEVDPKRPASDFYNYTLDLGEIAGIWKAGCIIRAGFLGKIKKAYKDNPGLSNLLLAPEFQETILAKQAAWREVLAMAANLGVAVPAFSASLDYFDSYRRERLPQNLTQAQRDFFGSHTYERIDQPGKSFHTEWEPIQESKKG